MNLGLTSAFPNRISLGGLILSLTFLAGTVSAGTHSAVNPVQRTDEFSKRRFNELSERVKAQGASAELVFLGDSITQGWEGAGKEVWSKHYGDRQALNLGIGGDRTQHVLWRLDNGHAEGLKPKAVVLMIGTNNSNGDDNSPGQIAEGVAAIVQKLRQKMPSAKILLLGIFPRGENFNNQRGKILQVNQVIHKLADGQNVFWMDFGHRFLNDDGLLPADIMPDYLHLSEKGYQIWAEAIEPRLSQLLGDKRAAAKETPKVNLAGEWAWTMDTPNGPVTAPLILKVDGNRVTGQFARDESRWLEIENGKLDGAAFTWTVNRDRPDGGIMVYQMSGKIDGNKITATARTTLDGNEVTTEWTAVRK